MTGGGRRGGPPQATLPDRSAISQVVLLEELVFAMRATDVPLPLAVQYVQLSYS